MTGDINCCQCAGGDEKVKVEKELETLTAASVQGVMRKLKLKKNWRH